jgi:putative ABC transport system ATP-binding protein
VQKAETQTDSEAQSTLAIDELDVLLGPQKLTLDRPCVLRAGRLYLVVGRSGSGKSSFARALLGFGDLSDPAVQCRAKVTLTDTAGKAHALWRQTSYDPAVRRHIAFLPQAERLGFLDALSVSDNLSLFSNLDAARAASEIDRLATQFELRPMPGRLASASGGERIRLSAIRGLMPRDVAGDGLAMVIADEPTAGLDRASANSMAKALVELARNGGAVVIVITHEPELFLKQTDAERCRDEHKALLVECRVDKEGAALAGRLGELKMQAVAETTHLGQRLSHRIAESLGRLGAVALGPLALVWGVTGMHRPLALMRQVLADALGLGTHAFSLTGCLLIAGTVAYFIFERMPKPEIVEPLLLPETLSVTGQALVRVVLPLGACCLITAKVGAAQAARLAAAVRGGLLETLALAGWRVEAFALVPAVLAQFLAMMLGTAMAVAGGVVLAAIVYVAGHESASLPLTINLMIDGLQNYPEWWRYITAKVTLSAFLGGSIAALYGIAPSRAEDDVARAVHRTLLWSVLAVIICQCALIIAEFAP